MPRVVKVAVGLLGIAAALAVAAYVISAGNGDPLLAQSRAFAAALALQGVPVDMLFVPDDYTPALPHEYQFNLDTEAGRLALERAVQFLRAQ